MIYALALRLSFLPCSPGEHHGRYNPSFAGPGAGKKWRKFTGHTFDMPF
jgi:hypothetical protein